MAGLRAIFLERSSILRVFHWLLNKLELLPGSNVSVDGEDTVDEH